MQLRVALGVLAVLLIGAGPAGSHHSQTVYEDAKTVTFTGAVSRFEWKNPHTWIYVDVTEKGRTRNWEVETNAAASLTRAGWKRDQFKIGDRVTVTVNPAKNGDPKGLLRKIASPGGKEFVMPGNGPQKPK